MKLFSTKITAILLKCSSNFSNCFQKVFECRKCNLLGGGGGKNVTFLWLKNDVSFKVHGDPDKKNEIFIKYCCLYLHDTDCKTVRLSPTENLPFQPFKI